MTKVDELFAKPELAELYDLFNPWGKSSDDEFYLDLVMSASSVLDVGCGTGLLLRHARETGHTGRLCGLDPADAMLDQARVRSDIEWIHGDLSTTEFEREFDLVIMTGHAFQVFLEDDHLRSTLAAVRQVLTGNGRFAFETRNPLVRAWERWTSENAIVVDYPGGGSARMEHNVDMPVEGELVSFTTTFTAPNLDGPQESRSTLRFLDVDSLNVFLTDSGFEIAEQYGYWDRSSVTDTSLEIITIARPD